MAGLITFGAPKIYGIPLTDGSGNAITNPTPVKIMEAQSGSLEFAGDVKQLHGDKHFSIAAARAMMDVSGSFTNAKIQGGVLSQLFFGVPETSGTMKAINEDSTGAAIPGTPYQITPTVPNSGTWVEDLGVLSSTGAPLTRVASSPATGEYSVSAGVYTFAAADTGNTVYINYSYTYSLATSSKIELSNLTMGNLPTIQMLMQTTHKGKRCLVDLNKVAFPKLSLLTAKNDDFSVPSVDFMAFANDLGTSLGTIYLQE